MNILKIKLQLVLVLHNTNPQIVKALSPADDSLDFLWDVSEVVEDNFTNAIIGTFR